MASDDVHALAAAWRLRVGEGFDPNANPLNISL